MDDTAWNRSFATSFANHWAALKDDLADAIGEHTAAIIANRA
jgi:hypothetical protein